MSLPGIIAVDVGGTKIRAGSVIDGALGHVQTVPTPASAGAQAILDTIAEATAVSEQDRLAQLFDITGAATPGRVSAGAAGLGGFKTALRLMGVIGSNRMAEPMAALDAAETERVREIVTAAGLL